MKLIDPRNDPWQAADAAWPTPAPRAHSLLGLAQWQAVCATWPLNLPVGVALTSADEVDALAADVRRLSLIVLDFPKWTDGRAYSQARLLRSRLRYAGELRAAGQVLVDMLPLLQRTGFDAALLRADQDAVAAQRALSFFSGHYQADPLTPTPHFARRAA